jgi:hypothetical protein
MGHTMLLWRVLLTCLFCTLSRPCPCRILFFFLSTIYNTGLACSLWVAHTNTEYSTTMLHSARYVLPKPRSLLLAGNHEHKAHGLFQDNVALSSSECGHEPPGHGNCHVYPRIALRKVPRPEPTTEGRAVPRRC